MPELPEVETVKSDLNRIFLENFRIQSVVFNRSDLRYPIPKSVFSRLLNQESVQIGRRGKYLEWKAQKESVLFWHLGMSGKFHFYPHEVTSFLKHEHVVLRGLLGDGKKATLTYEDPRRFGYILKSADFFEDVWPRLGVDPTTQDWTPEYLYSQASTRKKPIKALLMDESIVTGIGNIYASEICFRAKVSPLRKSSSLTKGQANKIVLNSIEVLRDAMRSGGSSIQSYQRIFTEGMEEGYQSQHRVYGRAGELCLECSHPIKLDWISGRSTFWCSHCQK